MSSSFPTARFLALPVRKDRGTADPTCIKVTAAPIDKPSDELLLSRIANEDREALSQLFRRYYGLVRGIAVRILRNDAEAEDLAQDVFLHIARKCDLYDSAKGTARSWIVRATYYQALNRKEHLENRRYTCLNPKGIGAEELAAPSANGYDHSGEAVFGRTRWLQMREVLTEDQWEAIRLHFFEGCTFAEIATKRKQGVANVRHHFYRGLARLRKYVFHGELRGC
jgi:RNA polymerase sigma-70 factor, ECF subfamily